MWIYTLATESKCCALDLLSVRWPDGQLCFHTVTELTFQGLENPSVFYFLFLTVLKLQYVRDIFLSLNPHFKERVASLC